MAPMKTLRSTTLVTKSTVTTRSKSSLKQITMNEVRGKRKAEGSPAKEPSLKRSAFGDVTNAFSKNKQTETSKKKQQTTTAAAKKVSVQMKTLPTLKTIQINPKTDSVKTVNRIHNENLAPPPAPVVTTRAAAATKIAGKNQTALKPKESLKDITNVKVKTRLSNEFEKTAETSLYSSALEEMNDSKVSNGAKSCCSSDETLLSAVEGASPSTLPSNVTIMAVQLESKLNLGNHEIPAGVVDFDKENWDDTFQVAQYAMDIFNYMKSREPLFIIPDYMDRQICLSRWMRSLLVDWMVEIQESFELNHETLYLGVKLVDTYLSKMTVSKETLQLVGAAAMFVASKYDERLPPPIDDFLYICDGAYTRRELIKMEINLLKICDFNLGIPISYRFLRRYARCAKITMPILTLARFILEYSLMDYSTVTLRDSKLAAAALYLALQMKKISGWTPTLEFYTGYKLPEFLSIVYLLNNMLIKKSKEQLMTVRNKYSHKIFFEVAKTPTILNQDIQV